MDHSLSRRMVLGSLGPLCTLTLPSRAQAQVIQPLPKTALQSAVRSALHLLTHCNDESDHTAAAVVEHAATSRIFFDLVNELGHDRHLVSALQNAPAPAVPFGSDPEAMARLVQQAGVRMPTRIFAYLQSLPPVAQWQGDVAGFHAVQNDFVSLLHQQNGIILASRFHVRRDTYRFVRVSQADQPMPLTDSQAKGILTAGGAVATGGMGLATLGFAAGENSLTAAVGATSATLLGFTGIGLMVLGIGAMVYVGYRYFSGPPTPDDPQSMKGN